MVGASAKKFVIPAEPARSGIAGGSRNPGPWPVLSAVVGDGDLPSTLSLDLGTMPSHVFTPCD